MKRIGLVLLIVIASIFSQEPVKIEPSVYLGWGLGANIGGNYGLGSEVRFNEKFSINVAGGVCPTISREYVVNYDVGIKYYMNRYLFLGSNYGLIDFETYSGEEGDVNISTRGLSVSAGFRTQEFHDWYLSGYIGINTDFSCSNSTLFGRTCILRFGIMMGYTFK